MAKYYNKDEQGREIWISLYSLSLFSFYFFLFLQLTDCLPMEPNTSENDNLHILSELASVEVIFPTECHNQCHKQLVLQ